MYFGKKKFDRENTDGQHLRPPVLAILLKTIERENLTERQICQYFPHQNITLYTKLNMIHCYFHEKKFMVNIIFTSSIYNFLMTNVFQMQFFALLSISKYHTLKVYVHSYLLLCIENYSTENFANFHKVIVTIRECVMNVHEYVVHECS